MKILSLHVDYIKFKPLKKAIKKIKDLSLKEKQERNIKDALVILIAVEKMDTNVKEITLKLLENIKEIVKKVNAKNVVLYPYAHLSSNLALPEIAADVLDKTEKELKKNFNVVKAPFGYYKEFELKVKGHPLSELSRKIKVNEKEDYKQLLKEISKSKLDTSKLKENDHRILGQQMDLYSFNETAPGMVFWHNNGLVIKNELINLWRELHKKAQYQEISTPQILDSKLWKTSGHWNLYKENMFLTEYEKREFAIKPMNCPGGMLVYKNKPKSYKDLPLRIGELGIVHRMELSGTLSGLFRVMQFTQDDAHIFCSKEQLENEIIEIIKLIKMVFDKFDFKYRFTLSTRSKEKKEKYLGDDRTWNTSEEALKRALKSLKIIFDITPGEAKFYGPSLDIKIKDSLNREWQCSTIQLDMQLPERFKIEYTDKDNKKKRTIILHRVIYGSLDRFIGILIEHYKGRLPVWLAPIQVRVLNFTDRNKKYAREIFEKIDNTIPSARIDFDFNQKTISSKVKDAELMKIPYIITIGDKEEKENFLAVRIKGNKKIENISIDNFINKLKKEIVLRT
jgi:threonyl-tRNA synthetase